MDERGFFAAGSDRDAEAMGAGRGDTYAPGESAGRLDRAADRRPVDARSLDRMASEFAELHQRCFDAAWSGTRDQSAQAGLHLLQALQDPGVRRLHVHAAAVQVGDHVRVRGHAADGEPEAATGVVEHVSYTQRVVDPDGLGQYDSYHGFAFAIRPVAPGHERRWVEQEEIWVRETASPEVLRLSAPVDRGRPAWLDQPHEPALERGPASVAGLSFNTDTCAIIEWAAGIPRTDQQPRPGRSRGR